MGAGLEATLQSAWVINDPYYICGHVPLLHPNMAFVFFPLISGYAKILLSVRVYQNWNCWVT